MPPARLFLFLLLDLPLARQEPYVTLILHLIEIPTSLTPKAQPVSDSLKLLLPLLISHNYQRAIITATCSYTAPEDQGGLKWRAVVGLIRLIGGSAYHEIQGIGAQVTSQDPAKLKWTLIRLPFLDNGDAKHVTATFTGSGKDGLFLSRKSAAAWVLDQLDSEEWVGKCPALCN